MNQNHRSCELLTHLQHVSGPTCHILIHHLILCSFNREPFHIKHAGRLHHTRVVLLKLWPASISRQTLSKILWLADETESLCDIAQCRASPASHGINKQADPGMCYCVSGASVRCSWPPGDWHGRVELQGHLICRSSLAVLSRTA